MTRTNNGQASSAKGVLLSRREFIKAAGATAAGVVIGSAAKSPLYSVAPRRVIGANDRIGLGIIGCGGQGSRLIGIVKDLAAQTNAVPVAVCDVYEKRKLQARMAAQISGSKAFGDYRKLLECEDVDAVLIATPEHWHAQIAIDAMEAGKHCYIEKPMTRHLEEAFKVHEAAKRTKMVVQIGSQGCTDAKWAKANELIRQGKIGKVVWSQGSYCRNSREGEWNHPIDPDANESNVDWNMWLGPCPKVPFDPERYFRFRKFTDYSAGILSDMFPHRLHPLLLAVGPEFPTKVVSLGTRVVRTDQEVADTQHILAEFPSGHTMFIAGSTANEQGLPDIIRGHKATLYLGSPNVELKPERLFADEIEGATVEPGGPGESIEEHQKNFYECIRTGKTPNCNVDLALRGQVVISLAEISYREHRLVSFDPERLKIVSQ